MSDMQHVIQQVDNVVHREIEGWKLTSTAEEHRAGLTVLLGELAAQLQAIDVAPLDEKADQLVKSTTAAGRHYADAQMSLEDVGTSHPLIKEALSNLSEAETAISPSSAAVEGSLGATAVAIQVELVTVRTALTALSDRVSFLAMQASAAETHSLTSLTMADGAMTTTHHYRQMLTRTP
jgi:hypothetical protein